MKKEESKIKTWYDKRGNFWMYASGPFDGQKLLVDIKKLFTIESK